MWAALAGKAIQPSKLQLTNKSLSTQASSPNGRHPDEAGDFRGFS